MVNCSRDWRTRVYAVSWPILIPRSWARLSRVDRACWTSSPMQQCCRFGPIESSKAGHKMLHVTCASFWMFAVGASRFLEHKPGLGRDCRVGRQAISCSVSRAKEGDFPLVVVARYSGGEVTWSLCVVGATAAVSNGIGKCWRAIAAGKLYVRCSNR